eukprot:gene47513-39375_t
MCYNNRPHTDGATLCYNNCTWLDTEQGSGADMMHVAGHRARQGSWADMMHVAGHRVRQGSGADMITQTGDAPSDYATSLMGNASLAYTPSGERHAPRTPNWNYTSPDHHWMIRNEPPLSEKKVAELDLAFVKRWRTLLSFRIPGGKTEAYQHDWNLPMLIKGPHISPNSTLPHLVTNVDLGPTIVALAGGAPPHQGQVMRALPAHDDADGRSFAHLLTGRTGPAWRTTALIEWNSDHDDAPAHLANPERCMVDTPNNTYRALRVINADGDNIVYTEFTDLYKDFDFHAPIEFELFDLNADPYQLRNLYSLTPESVTQKLHADLDKQWRCAGQTCP